MSLAAYTAKTWTDYADSPDLSAANVQYMDSGIAAVTAEVIALELALPTTYQPISAELSALAGLSSTGYAKRTGAGAWSVVASIPQADVSGLTTALAGKEAALGNPGTSGWVLSSTTAGVRSWVALPSVPAASSTAPLMNGTAAVGTGSTWARADHVHPSDTSKLGVSAQAYDSARLGGVVAASYALASSVPLASSTTPAALGTAAVGTGTTWARADHVHAMPTAVQVGAEPTLGNPGTSGFLLSSTIGGVRSWVAPYAHPATHPQSVVDSASGWITTALAGKQAAGNYLPLSAGSGKPLTGTLYGTAMVMSTGGTAPSVGLYAWPAVPASRTFIGLTSQDGTTGSWAGTTGLVLWADSAVLSGVVTAGINAGGVSVISASSSVITLAAILNGTSAAFSSRCTQAGSTIWDAGNLTWGGNGSAGTMARSDHNHSGTYQPLENQRLSTSNAPTFLTVTAEYAKVGSFDNAGVFARVTHFNSSNFALMQRSDGATIVNAAVGSFVGIRVNNTGVNTYTDIASFSPALINLATNTAINGALSATGNISTLNVVIGRGLLLTPTTTTLAGSSQINLPAQAYFEFNGPSGSECNGVLSSTAQSGSIIVIKGRNTGSLRLTGILDAVNAILAIDGSVLAASGVVIQIIGIRKFVKTSSGPWQEF